MAEALPMKKRRWFADGYQRVRVLGEGSFARTLLCRDAGGRALAVKQLRLHDLKGDWKAVELFEREARVLKALRHHGVPEVFDFFEADDEEGTALYLVQEHIDGLSLKQHLDGGPLLGELELVQIALGVLDVLAYLHGRTPPVYHRDVKPSNIMVRKTGAPVLVDFGGVCFGWKAPADGGSTIVGTYGYMPPEQLVGQVSPASDLYALGATLLHVITGRPPSDFPLDSGRIEIPADLPVRRELHELIAALLRPAPRDRPQSASAARELLLFPAASTSLVTRPPAQLATKGTAQYLDVGPPPRAPDGPFADAYRGLIDRVGIYRIRSRGVKALAIAGWVGLGLITAGIVPIVFYGLEHARREKYDPLFREGLLTEGRVLSAHRAQSGYSEFIYEYEVDGHEYRSVMSYEPDRLSRLLVGDRVAVLYDAREPSHSCFVVR
jgi:hypothetical protein